MRNSKQAPTSARSHPTFEKLPNDDSTISTGLTSSTYLVPAYPGLEVKHYGY
jgi:hypothetical protein